MSPRSSAKTPPAVPIVTPAPLPGNLAFMARFELDELAQRDAYAEAGMLVEVARLADAMRITPRSVSKAEREGRLFSLELASGRRVYPAFFAAAHLDRRQVQSVSRALGDLPGPSKWQFFTTPKVSLGGQTAIEALEGGNLAAVLVAAAGFLES